MHHHRRIPSLVHLFLLTVACGDWTPQPTGAPLDGSSSSGTTLDLPAGGGSTTWPGPVEWKPAPPDLGLLESGPSGELEHLDRWLVERTRSLVVEATEAYESYLSVNVLRAFEQWVDDVSNWYVRRSRRRFWDGDATALRTLWSCLVDGLRVVSPVMPFLTEHLWQHRFEQLFREMGMSGPAKRVAVTRRVA